MGKAQIDKWLFIAGLIVLVAVALLLGASKAGGESVELDFYNNTEFMGEKTFYTEDGYSAFIAFDSKVSGNLSNLFSNTNETFNWSASGGSMVQIYFPEARKVEKIRYYPAGGPQNKSYNTFYAELQGAYYPQKWGNDVTPNQVSGISSSDQYLEFNTSFVCRNIIFRLQNDGITGYYQLNEIEIFVNATWSPYPTGNVTINDSINYHNETIYQNITNITQELHNDTYPNITNITNVTVLNITNITQVIGTGANLTPLEQNQTRLEAQIKALQEALNGISTGNDTITIYQNKTVIERWDELNSTLANITMLQNRTSQNTTIYQNKTISTSRDADPTVPIATGAIVGAFSGVGAAVVTRRKQEPQKEGYEAPEKEDFRP